MKYCANCNITYPVEAERCTECGLPLLEMDGFAASARPASYERPEAPRPEVKPEPERQPVYTVRPEYVPPRETEPAPRRSAFGSAVSVVGAVFGALLLLVVVGVMVFVVFKDDLFGNKKEPAAAEAELSAPVKEAAPAEAPQAEQSEQPEEAPLPLTFERLSVGDDDVALYESICSETVWVTEDESRTVSFYSDYNYLINNSGSGIKKGRSCVSGGLLWLEEGSVLRSYDVSLGKGTLTLTNTDDGEMTVYRTPAPEEPEETPLLLSDLPVSRDDSDSYYELVEESPWTDADTDYELCFWSDGTYMASPVSGSGTTYFGSCVVSEGVLCMTKGSDDEIFRCSYNLSAGNLTLYYGEEVRSLMSEKAYNAMLLREQLSEELYDKLVEGSYWCSRDDVSLYNLYFYADHTFELCEEEMFTGYEYVLREGEAYIKDGILTLTFDRVSVSYEISVQENMLYLTDINSSGGTKTYESYSTFRYY